ncbi:MAG TPA: hypothetical protein VK797_15660 [Tepidisphaeraceae bacterium]|nr:hypothetical protein [Tepidisphaeraceae bacterium]
MSHVLRAMIFGALAIGVVSVGRAAAGAVEFPPGVFSDDAPIQIGDCRGRVVVLLFFDPGAERDWGDPEVARWMVSEYRDRPVKFVAVVPGRKIEEVRGTPADTPDVPAFADTLRVMESRAGGGAPPVGQWRYTVIGADGNVVGREGEPFDQAVSDIGRALPAARWEYRAAATFEKVKPAADCLECGQFARGAAMLRPLFSDHDPATSQTSGDLYARLRKEAGAWKAKAAADERNDPIGAYDGYVRVAAVFASDELGRSALRAMRKLQDRPAVRAELAARREYQKLNELSHPAQDAVASALAICREIASTYPGTPTAAQAAALAGELARIVPPPPAMRPEPAFTIRIDDFHGVEGFSLLYQVTPDRIAVGAISDFAGAPPKEMYRAALNDSQRTALAEFMRAFPLLALNHVYQDPTVNDGFQRSFEIDKGQVTRQIVVANRRQPDLERLCSEVNKLLPEKLRVRPPSWIVR